MKKLAKWIIILVVFFGAAVGGYYYYLAPDESVNSIYLVPNDAIYIIETENPIENWKSISSQGFWNHLRKNDYIADLTSSADALDSLIKNNNFLFEFAGSRKLIVSAHMFKKDDYDFLYIIDLKKASKFTSVQNYLTKLIGEGYKVTQRTYKDEIINELHDKKSRETLYISFIGNQLVVSYTHILVENSITEFKAPEIGRDLNFIEVNREIEGEDMFRIYLQYSSIDDFMKCYSEEPSDFLNEMSNSLNFTGLTANLDGENVINLKGVTNINDTVSSYFSVLLESGKGKIEGFEVASNRTASFIALGFNDFTKFYEKLDLLLQKDPESYKEYKDNIDKLENFLKIDIQDNFFSWIDDEIDIVNSKPIYTNRENEFALILKTKDADDAIENLDFINNQIRKKTPAKFKEVDYRGYRINYLSMTGFFKLILGKMFSKLEKPYYTVIDDFVIFSNHPQTLKNMIDDYIAGNTLNKSDEFNEFYSSLNSESSVLFYLNTGVLHSNLKGFADAETWKDLQKNKDFIVCFPHIGMNFTKDGDWFETQIKVQFKDPEIVKTDLVTIFELTKSSDQKEEVMMIPLTQTEENENIVIEEVILDDLSSKKQTAEFENGNLKVEVSLKDGLKDGGYHEYYESGELKIKGKYKADVKVGTWKMYDLDGNMIKKEKF